MADCFGIPQLVNYLTQMGLRVAHVDQQKEMIELGFQGKHGQWRMIVALQQAGEVRKLMLVAPHISAVTTRKRLECLEALMAVNYRIAMGKFGLDLDDGEVRLEESVPLANGNISCEQFRLVFGAMMQTVAIYHSLIPRILYSDLSAREALAACEQEYFQETGCSPGPDMQVETNEVDGAGTTETTDTIILLTPEEDVELNVDDVMAEVTRLLEEHKE